jgi:hypothetical protein
VGKVVGKDYAATEGGRWLTRDAGVDVTVFATLHQGVCVYLGLYFEGLRLCRLCSQVAVCGEPVCSACPQHMVLCFGDVVRA